MVPHGDGRTLCCYRSEGAAPGFLLVGGYGASSIMGKPLGPLLLKYARSRGQDALVMDFRGQGGSGGHWTEMTLPGMRDDLLLVARYFGLAGRIGIGASLGAWAMLAAQQVDCGLLRAMLALAPAVDWDCHYFAPKFAAEQVVQLPGGEWLVPDDQIRIRPAFIETAGEARLDPAKLRLDGALMVYQGEADAIVSPATTQALVRQLASCGEVALRMFRGAGHELTALRGAGLVEEFVRDCDSLLQQATAGQPRSAMN